MLRAAKISVMLALCKRSWAFAPITRLSRLLSTQATMSTSSGAMHQPELLALDFDGVVCASSGESSYTSILAACDFWPTEVPSIAPSSRLFRQIKDAVHALRPIVETGYENMLLVRLLHKAAMESGGGTLDVSELMRTWSSAQRDSLLLEYGSDKDTMVRAFGDARDRLIAEDPAFWAGLNEVYPWARTAMASQPLEYTIITTKQARFVQAILSHFGIQPPPASRLFDLENRFGPKTKVLQAMLRGLSATSGLSAGDLASAPLLPPSQRPLVHFVEDRFETLVAILESPELKANTKLYLVEFGYNTPEQRKAAKAHPDITLLTPTDFQVLLGKFKR